MKRYFPHIAAAFTVLLLSGCLSDAFNLGSPVNPPTDVKLVAGDGNVTVSWTTAPNVQYWIFSAQADHVTTDDWSKLLWGKATIDAVSPQVVSGLINGLTYSFTVNGRIDGGPGGAGSTSLSVVPRPAGATWAMGSPLANDLRAAAYGTVFVAAGAHGALYSSPDFNSWTPVTWTPRANPDATLQDLNAIAYGGASYVAAGSGGAMLLSSDAITWTVQKSGTTNNLYALTGNLTSVFVAAGANGTILTSTDGKTWNAANSGTTQNLFGLAYGNGLFVAVGANGTLLTSPDGTNWQSVASNASVKLNSVAFGISTIITAATGTIATTTTSNLFVAVGDNGTLVTSPDGVTWSVQNPISTSNLASVTYGRQFVAVGDGGTILTSTDGSHWQAQAAGTTNNLSAVAHNAAGYAAVGAVGTNLSAI